MEFPLVFFSFVWDGLLVAALLAGGLGPGRWVASRVDDLDPLERLTLALVAGLTISGTLLSALALAGVFRPAPVLVALALLQGAWLLPRRERKPPMEALAPRGKRWQLILPLAVAALVAAWLGLYPAAAFDDTMYHLPLARGLAEHGELVVEPRLRYPIFPLFQEVLSAALFVLGGGETSVHWLSTAELVLLGAVVFAWARRRAGEAAANLVTALLLGGPMLVWLGGAAYVDLALALFSASALWMLDVSGWLARENTAPPRGIGLVLAAGFAGSAAAVKYHGLFFCAMVALVGARAAWTERRPAILLALAATLPFALPWYLRNVLLTGNPLFPFLGSIFGRSDWSMPDGAMVGLGTWSIAEPTGMSAGAALRMAGHWLLDLLRSPWLLLEESIRPTTVPAFSPFASVALPLALPLALRRRETRLLAGAMTVYLALWLLHVRDVRYLAPWAAVTCVLLASVCASGAARWKRLLPAWIGPRTAAILLSLLLISPAVAFGALRLVKRGAPPLTEQARASYLDHWLPGHALLACAGRSWGRELTVYGFGTEQLQYYATVHLIGDLNGPYRHAHLEPHLTDPPALARALREMGADLLLTPAGKLPADAGKDGSLTKVASRGGFELWGVGGLGEAPTISDECPPHTNPR